MNMEFYHAYILIAHKGEIQLSPPHDVKHERFSGIKFSQFPLGIDLRNRNENKSAFYKTAHKNKVMSIYFMESISGKEQHFGNLK